MQKTLILILISAFLGTGVEAAASLHGHVAGDTPPALSDHHDGDAPESCDHCCHLSGHLLGIATAEAGHPSAALATRLQCVVIDGDGLANAPPVPPPNI